MKKIAVITTRLLLIILVLGLGCVFEDSLEKILNDFSKATEKLGQDVTNADKSTDSKAVSRALKNYGKAVEKIVDRLQALKEKHQEQAEELTIDWDKARKNFEDVMKEFANLVIKLAKYIADSDVMNALKEAQQEVAKVLK